MTEVAIVVQARTGSTRLRGKVLRDIGERPMLEVMLERLSHVRTLARVVVATTLLTTDDTIADLARACGVDVFRGNENDLLDRHVGAALRFSSDVVVKVPSDCPLIDPALVDDVLDVFLGARGALAYVSNLDPRTHPDGNDVEAISLEALMYAHEEATSAIEREHTTPFIIDRPERFPSRNVSACASGDAARFRYVVDYVEDLLAVNAIDEALRSDGAAPYDHRAIVALLEARPDIVAMNAMHVGDSWQRRLALENPDQRLLKGTNHARTREDEDQSVRG